MKTRSRSRDRTGADPRLDGATTAWAIGTSTSPPATTTSPCARRSRRRRQTELQVGAVSLSQSLAAGADSVTFRDVRLPAGTARVQGTIQHGEKSVGAHYVDLERKP